MPNEFLGALQGEIYRLTRNRGGLFWGFLFVPVMSILFAFALDLMMARAADQIGGGADPLRQSARSLFLAGNPFAHLFWAIGGATIFASEYRFATWRLLAPRLPRVAILTAKWLVFFLFASASLAVACVGIFLESALVAFAFGEPLRQSQIELGSIAVAFAGSSMELAAFGSLVAVASVLTRSMMGAVFPPFLFSLSQAMISAYLPNFSGVTPLLMLPTFAGDAVRRLAVAVEGPAPVSLSAVILAMVVLAAWAAVGLAIATMAFTRQDLSRE